MFVAKRVETIFFLLLILIIIYFYNPFALYFQNDDFVHIPLSAKGKILQHNSFRPVCDISLMIDYFLWGKKAWGYHLTNLALHVTDTILLFFFTRKICRRYDLINNAGITSFFVALLFFAYSSHSEAVFWILGRSAMIGMLFFLLTLLCYLNREKTAFFILSLFFMLLAWLSYESTWTLLFFVFLITFCDIRFSLSSIRKEKKFIAIIYALFIIYLFARFYYTGEIISNYEEGAFKHSNLSLIIINYFKQIMRSWLPPFENEFILIALFILVLLLIIIALIKIKERKIQSLIFVLILCWLVSLLPVVSLGIDTKGTESERFLYQPSFFVCLIMVVLIEKTFRASYYKFSIILVILIHSAILFKNSIHYRFAGEVTKTAVEQVKRLNKESLIVYNLPEEYHGALIFRYGFIEAVEWMKSGKNPEHIYILSTQKKDQTFTKNYHAENLENCIVPDSLTNVITKNNYACFVFADSSLQVFP